MPFKNTQYQYGLIAIALHWIVAAAFIANYGLVYYREWFMEKRSDAALQLISLHTAIGVSVFVFILLRIVWKWMNCQPADVPGSRFEHLAAHGMHWLLYAIMIIIPLTGYLGTGGPSQLFFTIEIPKFADTQIFTSIVQGWMGLSWEQFEPPMDFIHKQGGAYVVWVIIAAHASAALYHHFIRKDMVLKRMLSLSRLDEKRD